MSHSGGEIRRARVFPARLAASSEVAAFIAETCAAGGIARDLCLRLTLLVEELFVNTVTHGHGGDSEAPVELTLDVGPGRIALVYEDTAPPYDPFVAVTPPDEAAGVEERPVGGLGVFLVSSLARGIRYNRTGGKNRIDLVLSPPRD
ncbi:MAG TPA: ATP-binding protein [Candidatus Methylomirabilis sp.]|nr:ATP-binding protein [Candidatus Methylomirabilis sp.]